MNEHDGGESRDASRHRHMPPAQEPLARPSADDVSRMIAAEMRLPSRLGYSMLLLAGLAGAGLAGAMLLTEPGLPVRTQIAFGALAGIGIAWTAFATWVLARRRVLFAQHRVIAAALAVTFSALFTMASVLIGRSGDVGAAWPAATAVGAVLLAGAVGALVHARRRVDRLTRRRNELERLLRSVLLVLVTLAACFARTGVAPSILHAQPGTFLVRGTALHVDHGQITVPAHRASASAGMLTLRFVRIPTTSRQPGPPIVFLAGGPGDAATRAIASMPMELLDELRAIADVIAFDQRGTGTSEPLNPACAPNATTAGDGAARALVLPRDRPLDPAAILAALRPRVESCLADAAVRGIAVAGLTTLESADDLEALRRALGAQRLSLLAGSYGTHLALVTARRHPHAIARMALIGVEGHNDTFKLPSRVDAVIARIAETRRPALSGEIRTLRARLKAEPARFTFPAGQMIVLGEWELQRWIAESLDTRREIDTLLEAMPALIDGDYTVFAHWALRYRVPRPINIMNLAMDCASYATDARLQRIRAEARDALLGDVIDFPLPAICDVAGLPRLPDAFRTTPRSDVPALLVSGTFDGRTPVENAEDVAGAMPNARPLVIDGAAHDLFREQRVMDEVVRFLRDG